MRLGLVLLALLLALPAHADDSEARRQFERGRTAYNLQRYSEALDHFQAAYELKPAAVLLYNIAQCQRHLGQRAAAVASYRAYLREFPNAPNRDQAREFVAEMEATAVIAPPPAGQVAPPAPPIAPAVLPPVRSDAPRSRARNMAAWSTLLGGVVVAAIGGTLAGVGHGVHDDARRATSLQRQQDLLEQSHSDDVAGYALLGVGAAAAASGVVLFFALPAHRGHDVAAAGSWGGAL